MVEDSRDDSVPWRGRDSLYVALIYFVLLFFFVTRVEEDYDQPGFFLLIELLLGGVTLFWTRLYRSSGLLFGRRFRFGARALAGGLLVAATSLLIDFVFAFVVLTIAGQELSAYYTGLSFEQASTIVILSVVFVAPLVEEIFFRGLLQQGLERSFGGAVAIAISSLLFGVLHFQEAAVASIVSIGSGVVVGVLWGWVFLRYRNLGITICAHASVNAAYLLLGAA